MLTRDVVVVLPGIMGSTLRRDNTMVWARSAGTVLRAIWRFNEHLDRLSLPEGIGDEHPSDGVEPVGLMPDLHVLPGLWTPARGYDTLLDFLTRQGLRPVSDDPEAPAGNLLEVPYDWRLSNRFNGARLAGRVEPVLERWRAKGGEYADAKLVFVCHSMGGLVARWYLEHCGGAGHTRKLIMLGTPHRGAAKALDQLANGIMPRLGPLSPALTGFARTLPSLHQLLPTYACVDRDGDLHTIEHQHIAELSTAGVADAFAFHRQLEQAEAARGQQARDMTHILLGTAQTTTTTVTITNRTVTPLSSYQGRNLAGDATVPTVGATPNGIPLDSNLLRRIADKHGHLHRNRAALDELAGILGAPNLRAKAPGKPVDPDVQAPEILLAGDPLTIDVYLPDQARHGLHITVTDENGTPRATRRPRPQRGHAHVTITDLPPGGYTIHLTGTPPATPITPVTSDLLIYQPATAP